jgi:hypothetical protein
LPARAHTCLIRSFRCSPSMSVAKRATLTVLMNKPATRFHGFVTRLPKKDRIDLMPDGVLTFGVPEPAPMFKPSFLTDARTAQNQADGADRLAVEGNRFPRNDQLYAYSRSRGPSLPPGHWGQAYGVN